MGDYIEVLVKKETWNKIDDYDKWLLAEYHVKWEGKRWSLVGRFVDDESILDYSTFIKRLREKYVKGFSIREEMESLMKYYCEGGDEILDREEVIEELGDLFEYREWFEDTAELFDHFGDGVMLKSSYGYIDMKEWMGLKVVVEEVNWDE